MAGAGTRLSLEQLYAYARAAGFSHDGAVMMAAIAIPESGGWTGAFNGNTKTGDQSYGLWQINMLGSMGPERRRQFGISSNDALFDPMTNARAAFIVSGGGSNFRPWSAYKNNLHASSLSAARAAGATVGDNWSSYVSGAATGTTFGSGTGIAGGQVGAASAAGGAAPGAPGGAPYRIPADARVVSVAGTVYTMFDLGAGVWISYRVSDPNTDLGGRQPEVMTQEAFNGLRPVNGGDARELNEVALNYGTYGEFWKSVLTTTMGPNPAKDDPEVRRIIAEFAGRPDMSEAELQNKLRSTNYWNARTDLQREWNDLSNSEKAYRVQERAAALAQQFFEATGRIISVTDPRVVKWATDVASGKMGIGQWYETVLKPFALSVPESPLARQVRGEQEEQLQRGVDIENKAEQVRSLYKRWGVPVSEETINTWAKRMTENQSSEEDLMKFLRAQATILYPTKDPEIETSMWAEPWLQTYARVMEVGQVDMTNPQIQEALAAGMPVYTFEQQLKQSDEWLQTKNAQTDMSNVAFQIGSIMGFN